MDIVSALGAGLVVAILANFVRLFFKLLNWEHKKAMEKLAGPSPRVKWTEEERSRWTHAFDGRQLAAR